MQEVPASIFQKNPAMYQDQSLTEPVVITNHGRRRHVLMGYAEFEKYELIKQQLTRVYKMSEISDEKLQAILSAKLPDDYPDYDDEMDE